MKIYLQINYLLKILVVLVPDNDFTNLWWYKIIFFNVFMMKGEVHKTINLTRNIKFSDKALDYFKSQLSIHAKKKTLSTNDS